MTGPGNAVFLSYASEDAAAAARICATLRAAGIEVWFDQSELRGGDAWDAAIRRQIKACALFMPLISTHSRERIEGYFRLEWKLAVDRSHLMAAEKPFLVPVLIDATREDDARVPDRFREVQWTRLPDGATSDAFVAHVLRLLHPVDAPAPQAADAAPGALARVPPRAARRLSPLLLLVTLLLVGALGYIVIGKSGRAPPAAVAPAPAAGAAVAAVSDKSIAVLPFTDMSEKKDQEYFSDGLSEELIDLLARIPELKVTARTSSFSFRGRPVTVAEIGQALRVANVLEGSVRKSGNTLRITAQLVRADNGYHLWSETYDRDLKDVFKVQDDIARVVVDKLKLTLTGAVPSATAQTTNPQVHNLYLEGMFAAQSDTDLGTAKGLAALRRAVALDPGYAPAWNRIAAVTFRRGVNGYQPVLPALDAATEAVERALALDPDLAEGYVTLAGIRTTRLDWPGTAAAIDKALALDPTSAAAQFQRAILIQVTGAAADAVTAARSALERDPLNLLHRRYLARILYHAGKLDEAETTLRQIDVASPAFSAVHYELGRVRLARGDIAGAVSEFESERNPVWRVNGLPLGYHAAGRKTDEHAAMANLLAKPEGAEYQIAEAYAYTGNADQAFAWLDRAVTRDPGIIWIRGDPLLAAIAHDARYGALLARLRMPPAT
jgi:TolB-like protein